MIPFKKIIDRAVSGGLILDVDEFISNLETMSSVAGGDISEPFIDSIIFDHSFLRAFFGETFLCMACGKKIIDACSHFEKGIEHKPSWQYHAQQLVLSEDRLKYLSDYMEG